MCDTWWQDCDKHKEDVLAFLGPARCDSTNWSYDCIHFSIEGALATVVLGDVKNSNGLTNKFTRALIDICLELIKRPDVKVAVFTARGAYFCTGGAFGGASPDDALYARKMEPWMSEEEKYTHGAMDTACLFYLLGILPQYKVAAIRGKCMGAGNSLVASMDYVVAPDSKKLKLSFMEATRGLAACISWQGITSRIGVPQTRRFTMISDELDAHAGKEAGLISEVVGADKEDVMLRQADARALQKGNTVAELSHDEIAKHKRTGPKGCPTKLLEVPTAARGCAAMQGKPVDWQAVVQEVLEKCSRKGRPAPARLSNRMWRHKSVRLEKCGQHVAVIKLTRPETGNAVDREMVEGLLDAAVELHMSVGKVRLVHVQAEGMAFCSGLHESLPIEDEELQQMLFLFYMLPMYVMGIVEGDVSGFGLALCSTFDVVAASGSAVFDFAGLADHHGAEFVSNRIGMPAVKELIGSKAKKTAEQMKSVGVVGHIVDGEKSIDALLKSVCDLVSKTAPNAVAESKAYLQGLGTHTVDFSVLESISRHIALRNMDPEFNDSIKAIVVPGHEPMYNKGEDSKVLPSRKASDVVMKTGMALEDGVKASVAAPARVPVRLMI